MRSTVCFRKEMIVQSPLGMFFHHFSGVCMFCIWSFALLYRSYPTSKFLSKLPTFPMAATLRLQSGGVVLVQMWYHHRHSSQISQILLLMLLALAQT